LNQTATQLKMRGGKKKEDMASQTEEERAWVRKGKQGPFSTPLEEKKKRDLMK